MAKQQIDRVHVGDGIQAVREETNIFKPNNYTLLTEKGKNFGNVLA